MQPQLRITNVLATYSALLLLVGIVLGPFGLLVWPLAYLTGRKARRQIREGGDVQDGATMAKASMIVSVVLCIATICLILFPFLMLGVVGPWIEHTYEQIQGSF